MLLTREKLLKRDDLSIEKVDLGNGDFVFVRQMTGHERDSFEQSLLKEIEHPNGVVEYKRSVKDFRAKLAVQTICDEKGNLILKPNDIELLSNSMSAAKLEKVIEVAQRLNAMDEQTKEKMVKN